MTLFTIARLNLERQRNAGRRIVELLDAEASAKKKRPDAITERSAEFKAAHEALSSVSILPKITVDNTADRGINGSFNELTAIVQTFSDPLAPLEPAASARYEAARTLLRVAFPKGRGFTQKSMSTQLDGMRDTVKALRSEDAKAAVKTLAWSATVDYLESLLAPYGVAVRSPDGADVEKLSDAWHAAFSNLAAALVGTLPESDALRVSVLDTYEKQLTSQAEAAAERRRAAKKAAKTIKT